jgi:hypothetical protein
MPTPGAYAPMDTFGDKHALAEEPAKDISALIAEAAGDASIPEAPG